MKNSVKSSLVLLSIVGVILAMWGCSSKRVFSARDHYAGVKLEYDFSSISNKKIAIIRPSIKKYYKKETVSSEATSHGNVEVEVLENEIDSVELYVRKSVDAEQDFFIQKHELNWVSVNNSRSQSELHSPGNNRCSFLVKNSQGLIDEGVDVGISIYDIDISVVDYYKYRLKDKSDGYGLYKKDMAEEISELFNKKVIKSGLAVCDLKNNREILDTHFSFYEEVDFKEQDVVGVEDLNETAYYRLMEAAFELLLFEKS